MKKKLAIAFKIFLSAALLTFLFYKVPFSDIIDAMAAADLRLIAAAFSLHLVYLVLSAYETSYLTRVQGMFISTWVILKIHLASMFYNLFLPGLISGGAVKWYKFSKYGSRADAAAVVAFNRLLETLMLILTGIIFSIPVIMNTENTVLIIAVFALLAVVLSVYLLFLNQKFLFYFEKIILKIPFPQIIKKAVGKIFGSMHRFRDLTPRQNAEIFGLLFFYHSITIFTAYLLALSLNINITFYDMAWIRTAVTVLILLPFSFAGLGVREGSLIYFLGTFGVSSELAMAYSLILFLNLVVTSLIGGAFEFVNFISGKKVQAEADA